MAVGVAFRERILVEGHAESPLTCAPNGSGVERRMLRLL
jgi:hypothetical protein